MDVQALTIATAREGIRTKQWSAVELTRAYLDAITAHDATVHAYLEVAADEALEMAGAIDRINERGEELPVLAGAPLAIKDNILVQGRRAGAASRILEPYVAPYDAFVIERLRAAGAVFIGRTNMDEFAMGSSTENSAYGPTRNPWNTETVPGGSSGGSAAAVASGTALAALGSDTGGSVRQPAALCGIVGMKPTYGCVSRSGLMAMASSLDQIGPLARTVGDARAVYDAIAGDDPLDATTVAAAPRPKAIPIKKLRIGIPKEYSIQGMDPEVESAVKQAAQEFKRAGASVEEISLPHTSYGLAVYYILQPAEVSANLSRYDGIRYGARVAATTLKETYEQSRSRGLGREAQRRIMLGTYVLSSGYYDAYYRKAAAVRTLVRRDFERAFGQVDCILTPTTPTPAWKIGEKFSDPLTMYLSDIFTVSANVAGIPAISVPCGMSRGLPLGLQLMAAPFAEETLFAAAEAYEQATDWHTKNPPLLQRGE